MNTCRICGNIVNNELMVVREMMFGIDEEFQYCKCAKCGCLQIISPPNDMAKYYDSNKYYSYHMQVKTSKARDLFHKLLFFLYTFRVLPAKFFYLRVFPALHVIKKIPKNAAILDIGCGDGRLVQDMGVWGYKNCTGIDPFIGKDTFYPYGVKILKQDIFGHNGQYDLIMMHHSLEHLDNQHDIFKELFRLLKPDGTLLICVPVVDGYPYRKYGVNWYAIDAPRHFYLHTTQSILTLSNVNGFMLKKVEHNSGLSFFINRSETLYKQTGVYKEDHINRKRKRFLEKEAKRMNAMLDGGSACFILKKKR